MHLHAPVTEPNIARPRPETHDARGGGGAADGGESGGNGETGNRPQLEVDSGCSLVGNRAARGGLLFAETQELLLAHAANWTTCDASNAAALAVLEKMAWLFCR